MLKNIPVVAVLLFLVGGLASAALPPTEYLVPQGSVDARPLHWFGTTNHGFSVSVLDQGIDLWRQGTDGAFTNVRLEAIPKLLTHIPFEGNSTPVGQDIFYATYDPTTGVFGFGQLPGEGGDPFHNNGLITTYTQGNIANPGRWIVAAGNANATAQYDEIAVLVEPELVLVFDDQGFGNLGATPTVVGLPPGTQGDMIVMADVAGDSKKEILVGSTGAGAVTVMSNATPFTQGVSFTYLQTFAVPGLVHLDTVDMDGSGKADIVAIRNSGGADEVVIALNSNGGTPFTTISSSVSVDAAPQMVAAGELLPADGRPDVLVVSNPSPSYSSLIELTNLGGTVLQTGSYPDKAAVKWVQVSATEFAIIHNPVVSAVTVYPMDPSGSFGLSPADQILAGGGADAGLQAEVRVRRADGFGVTVSAQPYGAAKYGTKVGSGDINGTSIFHGSDEVLTGPGPNPVYGPHVRGFQRYGNGLSPIPKVSFFAYGTLKWGVNVAAGSIDADLPAEIITGAGPGSVFGPHIRGFNFDGTAVGALSKVNAFGYSTLKYGVEVGDGDVDGDGMHEVLTGPGPGAMFGSQVRGWNYDGTALTSIGKINFVAWSGSAYGCTVAAGDVDEDGIEEIATGRGAGPAEGAEFRGYDFDGSSVRALPGFAGSMSTPGGYGCRVGLGDVAGTLTDARDELLAGHGPDPAASSSVELYLYGGAALESGSRFETFAGFAFGVNVATGAMAF